MRLKGPFPSRGGCATGAYSEVFFSLLVDLQAELTPGRHLSFKQISAEQSSAFGPAAVNQNFAMKHYFLRGAC